MTDTKTIYFDMDGTIADLYGVDGWLNDLINSNVRPYAEARPLIRLSALAKRLNNLQRKGYKVGVISWLSKSGTPEYNAAVTKTKREWLKKHIPSVKFDEISIVPYGTPKSTAVQYNGGILFDDEENNRNEWKGVAYNVNNILGVLKGLA